MDWVDHLRQAVDAKGKHSLVAADAGIHPSSLSDILNRVSSPQFETVIDICRVCGINVGWIRMRFPTATSHANTRTREPTQSSRPAATR